MISKKIIVLLLIIAAISIPAYTGQNEINIVSKDLVKGSSPTWFSNIGYGDRLYKITYSDDSSEYTIERNIYQPRQLFISGIDQGTDVKIAVGSTAKFTIRLYGISSVLDGQQQHDHEITIFDINTGQQVMTQKYCCITSSDLFPEYYAKDFVLGTFTSEGIYEYLAQEYVYLAGGTKARGDAKTLRVTVGNPQPATTPTIQPTYATPEPTTTPGIPKPKPVIIPPEISKFMSTIFGWLQSLLGLSISGGQTVDVQINKQYTTTLSLAFTNPDSDYSDGLYQTTFAEWFIADANQNVKHESGWIQLTASPYSATAQFTPTSAGKYYLIGVVVKQDYTYGANGWIMTETIETKEVQELNAKISAPQTTSKPTATAGGIVSLLWAWIKSLFGWI